MSVARESAAFSGNFTARNVVVVVIVFLAAHLALLVGVTTPEKFYFDEVHYVPAARQMLQPVMPRPMLNPMHPPLAKQLMALSIRTFGDGPLGWRYPSALFGALAIVAMYLCGLALFAAQGPALASALLAFFNQMVFVQSRIAMLDIFALTFGLFAIAAFIRGFRNQRPHVWFALAGFAFGLSTACKWSGLFALAVCIAIVAVIRLMQSWRTQFADGNADDWYQPGLWPNFRYYHFAACFVLIPAVVYLATFVPLYGLSLPDILEAQRKIFNDNITTAIAGHTYMSAWPSWPFLVRPVWYLFDKIGEDRIAAVVFLGNPLVLWPALPALAICLRDWIATRRTEPFDPVVLCRALAGLGVAAADARLHLLLSAIRNGREPCAGLRFEARQQPALAVMGLRRDRVRGLCGDAADLGGVGGNLDGDVRPADNFPELDLRAPIGPLALLPLLDLISHASGSLVGFP